MNWVFPMAGRGVRTQSLGPFKPFIEVSGKLIVEWFLLSMRRHFGRNDTLIFIANNEDALKFSFSDQIEKILKTLKIKNRNKFVFQTTPPKGPADTVYQARGIISSPTPVVVVNCDQYIEYPICEINERKSGYLAVYTDFSSKSSFARVEKGEIKEVVEKNNISNIASAGVYGVSSGEDLITAIEYQFQKEKTVNGEYYVGPALNYLISNNFTFYPVSVVAKFDLGSVEGIESFKKCPLVTRDHNNT